MPLYEEILGMLGFGKKLDNLICDPSPCTLEDLYYHKEEVMDIVKFEAISKRILDQAKNVRDTKIGEYYDASHRLSNFIAASGLLDITVQETIAGMMAKHTVSIYDMVRKEFRAIELIRFPILMWEEKIIDHINYLLILHGSIVEDREKRNQEPGSLVFTEKGKSP